MKTFNKRGDAGETSLLFGERVLKSDPRCEGYGTIDEAVSALGVARALSPTARVQEIVLSAQRELFAIGAEIATTPDNYGRLAGRAGTVTSEMVERLERLIDVLEGEIGMPRSFIVPGGSPSSAALDLARSIIRRAERRAVELKDAGVIRNAEILRYLNRLADLMFTVARYEEAALSKETLKK
ncbi:MAG: cob(I)yrinic acid a,c-diamide adenosyltransferase [Chloroflexi bacterium]|nr:cob(I)yrinic acid a,c-diamide adenosyltransferase [Chloroflexota bacterium]